VSRLPSPSPAAIRAVRQYRRRDVVPYLALRYYLSNRSARRARWAEDVAVQLVLERKVHPYFSAKHFKARDDGGEIRYRQMFLPGANEALAESVLLGECGRHAAFQSPSSVFSYSLASGSEVDGIFRHYFKGLQERQRRIARACRGYDRSAVRYADIREFYPSIPPELARRAWDKRCAEVAINRRLVELGHRLLDAHVACGKGKLLTGPMFSHLLGNLVLRGLDDAMGADDTVTYCRYVDDIVLVGTSAAVDEAYKRVADRLGNLGLTLHPPGSGKHLDVDGQSWLRGEHDFQDGREAVNWKSFVGALKRLLTSAPERRDTIHQATRCEGFRVPIPDYSGAIREAPYIRKLEVLVRRAWFWEKRGSLEDVLRDGRTLRARYLLEIDELLNRLQSAHGYERKRLLPKIRYRAGRLAYLASAADIAAIGEQLREVPDLYLHATVLLALATGDVTETIRLGTNVAQAVAQALHAADRPATVQGPVDGPIEVQGLAVLALNGVNVTGAGSAKAASDEFLRLATDGADLSHLCSGNAYVRDLASLHGVDEGPRHATMLDSAFDVADDSVFDALSQAIYLPSEW
jgi:hypothetical protein